MRHPLAVDQRLTDLWLWRHGQGERGDRAPLVRFLARVALEREASDAEVDFLLDLAMVDTDPEWLAIRTLPDGRFAGVMPALDGYGVLGVSPYALPDAQWFAATWEYERAIDAIAALNAWDAFRFPEPGGFSRRCGGPPIRQAVRMPGARCG